MCCCISGEPIEAKDGKIKTFHGPNMFQTDMLHAPCAGGCGTCCWFMGQFLPFTCGCTQFMLRRKVLMDDMSKYSCCQGYYDCCGFGNNCCHERSCPTLCLCCESFLCNSCAISASRMYVMERYQLSSDPCDYRLIRINNCCQILACICNILAIISDAFRSVAFIIDRLADLMYQCISGCMTAQVAHEMNFQVESGGAVAVPTAQYEGEGEYAPKQEYYDGQQQQQQMY